MIELIPTVWLRVKARGTRARWCNFPVPPSPDHAFDQSSCLGWHRDILPPPPPPFVRPSKRDTKRRNKLNDSLLIKRPSMGCRSWAGGNIITSELTHPLHHRWCSQFDCATCSYAERKLARPAQLPYELWKDRWEAVPRRSPIAAGDCSAGVAQRKKGRKNAF